MLSKKRRFVEGVLLIALLLFIAVFFLLQPLLSSAISARLTRSGFRNLQYHLAFPGMRAAEIRDLEFEYGSGGLTVAGKVSSVAVSYDILELHSARISSMTLSNALIKLGVDPLAKSDPPSTSGGPERFLKLLQTAPLAELRLSDVQLRAPNVPAVNVHEGQLVLGAEPRFHLTADVGTGRARISGSLRPDSGALSLHGQCEFSPFPPIGWELAGEMKGERTAADVAFTYGDSVRLLSGRVEADAGKRVASAELKGQWEQTAEFVSTLAALHPVMRREMPMSGGRTTLILNLSSNPLRWEVRLVIASLKMFQLQLEDLEVVLSNLKDSWMKSELRLSGGLLGGQLKVQPAPIDFEKKRFALPVSLEGISIEKLLAAYPQEQFTASGPLDASFTLQKSETGIEISKGQLEATAPGVIQFRGQSLQGPGLDIALEALRDFRYDVLRAPLRLEADGRLTINLFLRGRNPAWQNGRTVEFSINLEQNLYSFLQTLRLSRGELKDLFAPK